MPKSRAQIERFKPKKAPILVVNKVVTTPVMVITIVPHYLNYEFNVGLKLDVLSPHVVENNIKESLSFRKYCGIEHIDVRKYFLWDFISLSHMKDQLHYILFIVPVGSTVWMNVFRPSHGAWATSGQRWRSSYERMDMPLVIDFQSWDDNMRRDLGAGRGR